MVGVGASVAPAVDIQNNTTANVRFQTLTMTNATRPLPLVGGAGLNIINNPASVTVTQLDATTTNGIALFALNAGVTTLNPSTAILSTGAGGLTVTRGSIFGGTLNDGSINTVGREAINVSKSVIDLKFTSVSDVNSGAEGIRLVDNVAIGNILATTTSVASNFNTILFSIAGQPGVPGSGGTINNSALDGGFFQNTGGVSLSNVNFTNNIGAGIFSQTAELDLFGLRVQTNGKVGVDVDSTPFFSMFGSVLNNNGLNEVRFTASSLPPITTTNGVYSVTLGNAIDGNGNQITAATVNDAVLIQTQGAGAGSFINPSIVNNAILTSGLGSDPLHMIWNGPIGTTNFRGLIALNRFTFTGNNSTGVFVDLPSSTASSKVNILSNNFSSPAGIATTGIFMRTSGGPSDINIGTLAGLTRGNQMSFISGATALGAVSTNVGMQFTLGPNTGIDIFDNDIAMNGNLSQGMQFTTIQGPSVVRIYNNTMNIDDGPDTISDERGINILGASGSVTLIGVQNNDILMYGQRGSGLPYFFAPPGSVNGGIVVNGVFQP